MSEKAKRYNFSASMKDEIYRKTGGICFYCGDKLENENILDAGGKTITVRHHWRIDHKLPVSRGGQNNIDNLVPACISCNAEKGTMTAEEFFATRSP